MEYKLPTDPIAVFPELNCHQEQAVDVVIATLNQAKERMGMRQDLFELAESAAFAWADHRLSLQNIKTPIALTAEKFIIDAIENHWNLTEVFKYCLNYMGESKTAASQFYYFEAVFSQPTAAYPIPQATASVFFRIEDKLTDKEKAPKPNDVHCWTKALFIAVVDTLCRRVSDRSWWKGTRRTLLPIWKKNLFVASYETLGKKWSRTIMCFRIEGNSTDHDVRFVAPTADWILALLQMKLKFFARLETLNLF